MFLSVAVCAENDAFIEFGFDSLEVHRGRAVDIELLLAGVQVVEVQGPRAPVVATARTASAFVVETHLLELAGLVERSFAFTRVTVRKRILSAFTRVKPAERQGFAAPSALAEAFGRLGARQVLTVK
jgi:hypothetical protein